MKFMSVKNESPHTDSNPKSFLQAISKVLPVRIFKKVREYSLSLLYNTVHNFKIDVPEVLYIYNFHFCNFTETFCPNLAPMNNICLWFREGGGGGCSLLIPALLLMSFCLLPLEAVA